MSIVKKFLRWFYSYIILKYKVIFLRLLGGKIGKNCIIYTKLSNIEKYYTSLLEIGNNVMISKNVFLFCHDYSKKHLGISSIKEGKIKIGDNCFIGVNSVILPNVKIGNNVIVGAGSVVTKDIPDNTIAAGNPTKVIRNFNF